MELDTGWTIGPETTMEASRSAPGGSVPRIGARLLDQLKTVHVALARLPPLVLSGSLPRRRGWRGEGR